MCRYWQSSARSVLVRRCRTLGRAGPCCASVAARVTAPAVCYSKPPSGWAIMPTATKAVEDLFAKISREAAAPSDSNPSGTAAAAAPTKTQVRPNRALHHTHTQLARRTQRQQARPLSRRTGLIAHASRPPPQPPLETFSLFVGQHESGKSSLLALLQSAGGLSGKDDKPKPTVALEYMFARRTGSANGAKDVAHIWELGASVMRGSATRGGRCVARRLGSRTL